MFIWALRCVHKDAETCMWGNRNCITMPVPYLMLLSRDFPQTVLSGGGTPEWVLFATLEGRAEVWESEPDWRLHPGSRLARRCGTLQQLLTPHPCKANLVFVTKCFCNCPSGPVHISVCLFVFSFVTKVTNELMDSSGKGRRHTCLGSVPPSAFLLLPWSPSAHFMVHKAKLIVKSSLDKNASNLRVTVITVGCQGGMWLKYTWNVLLNAYIKT